MFKRGSGAAADAFARILANTGWLLGGKGVGAVLSLAYLAIVTRTLGVADFGRFALVLSAANVIKTLVSFDSWQIVVRYGQPHLAAGNGDALNRVLRFCILIDLASAAAGAAIAAGVILFAGPLLGLEPDMGLQVWLFALLMMITIRSSPTGVLRLFDRFDSAAFAETMIPVGRMIGALVAWVAAPGITAFLLAWAFAELLCAASYWFLALRVGGTQIGSWRAGRALDARAENPGIVGFLTATNLQTSLSSVGQQVAVLIVGAFVGPAGAGLYRLANQLANSLTKISSLLSRSIFVSPPQSASMPGMALFVATCISELPSSSGASCCSPSCDMKVTTAIDNSPTFAYRIDVSMMIVVDCPRQSHVVSCQYVVNSDHVRIACEDRRARRPVAGLRATAEQSGDRRGRRRAFSRHHGARGNR